MYTQYNLRGIIISLLVDKILFFKYLLEDDKKVATKEEMHDFIQTYLDRYDEEYNELVADQRKGRPSPPRLTLLESLREKEAKDYRLIGVGKHKSGLKNDNFLHC